MMHFKLAVKNIRKSIHDYSIYFMTLVIGVIVFYIFNALETQTIALNVSKSAYDIIELMNMMLNGVSVFVAMVLGGLIIYASRFLIKRRSKEFGVYLTLGMSKRRMSTILFIETLIIGVISLVVGLLLGIVLSQFMSIVVANVFEADMSKFTFVFAPDAAVKTIIYFGIMYVVVMIFNTISIGRCKLIDLLHGAKKNEQLKLRNPLLCLVVFIASWVLLGFLYKEVTQDLLGMMDAEKELIKVIILGAIATFFVFWSMSGMMLQIFTKLRGVYFKKINSFTLRQFSSKANTMVISMTVICLMLFLTIVMLGAAISLTHNLNGNLKALLPCDAEFVKNLNLDEEDFEGLGGYDIDVPAVIEDSKVGCLETLEKGGFDTGKLTELFEVYVYDDDSITMGATCSEEYLAPVMENYLFVTTEETESIYKLSDYNKIAELFGNEKLELGDGEYAMVSDFDPMIEARTKAVQDGTVITVNGQELKPAYDHCISGTLMLEGSRTDVGAIIVNDDVVDDSMITEDDVFANYNADTKEGKYEIEDELMDILDQMWMKETLTSGQTKISIKAASVGLAAMASFISIYIGIIFLMASAAVLSLKELSESADNVEKYAILRRIGVDEKMINGALFKQIGMFFAFPMLIACIHSIFGLKAANQIFEVFGTEGLGTSIFVTALIIVAVYGGYFLLTFFSSKRIIRG